MAKSTHRNGYTQNPSATNDRNFRTFLLMQQFAAREIGERIARARKEADGMTQEQLAETLDVSTRSVQDYEAGTTIPWKYFSRLEEIFRRPLGWFLHGEEAPQQMPTAALGDRLDQIQKDIAELRALLENRATS